MEFLWNFFVMARNCVRNESGILFMAVGNRHKKIKQTARPNGKSKIQRS
jgi:hypothetical protein